MTSQLRLSPTKRVGTKVRPSTEVAGTSKVWAIPFIYAVSLFNCSFTIVPPFVAVISLVELFHTIVAPNSSKIARTGTKVRPSMFVGGTSKEIGELLIIKFEAKTLVAKIIDNVNVVKSVLFFIINPPFNCNPNKM